MDFLAVTGLHYREFMISWNLIVDLSGKNRLREYYKEDRSVLEHFRFKDLFIHGSKKAFISFVPLEIVEKVTSGPSTTCNVFPK